MNAQQAIEIAGREGFCHIGQHTFLWKTCEAASQVRVDGITTPFVLVIERDWSDFFAVKDATNTRLIKAIEERK